MYPHSRFHHFWQAHLTVATVDADVGTHPPLTLTELESNDAGWDAFVAAESDGSFCHLLGWRDVMTRALGHECHYWAAVDEAGKWHGVIPLVRVRGGIFGDQLVSMPFLNYGGPLGTPAARQFLAAEAVALGKRARVKQVELRTRVGAVSGLAEMNRKVTVVLPLPESPQVLFERTFPAKLRSQIRRPQKVGMAARFGVDQLPAFYEVYARNMRDLGTPVMPARFFEALVDAFPEQLVVAAVYSGDRAVAAGCGFLWQGEFEMTWASSIKEYNQHSPNMLLYWALMEHVMERGATVFNFGRCTPGGGTHRFKMQWGGTTEALPWRNWSAGGSVANQDQPIYRLATRIWMRMPLPVANRVGPLLARGLP